MIKIEAHKIE